MRTESPTKDPSGEENYHLTDTQDEQIGLVMQGNSFAAIQSCKDLAKLFVKITSKCNAIIICRASPSQKASVVQLIKASLTCATDTVLAIGDGSNDVAMIHAAHVGIGIYGQEGTEAASSADYAIDEF